MCLFKIVFAVFALSTVTNYVFVSGQDNDQLTTEPPEEKTSPPPVENHTFVALIDIVFVDGNKRQCTGTIIHDNVVVTAAHCFLDNRPGVFADIELSGSFVVIGTKKMFDTGYENYLPIERIVTHPRYKGWTADIALVFTFAGMTTEKPGYALPLVGESASTPVDSNVTILSWGRCPDDEKPSFVQPGTSGPARQNEKRRSCTSSEEQNGSCEATKKPLRSGRHSSEQEHSSEAANSRHRSFDQQVDKLESSTLDLARVTTAHNSHRVLDLMRQLSQGNSPEKPKQSNESHEPYEHLEPTPLNETIRTDNVTIYKESSLMLTTEAEVKTRENLTKVIRRLRKRNQKPFRKMSIVDVKDKKWPKDQTLVEQISGRNASSDEETAKQSHYKNLRRQTKSQGPKENSLTVETFGFVNVQTCKKLVDKVNPSHGINTNEVVCYAADEHYISDDDSGAPAVRQGHLVAVTVGGVECEGDHVAIGMKMNCFCSWIAENLPENDLDWKCCEDCCSGDEPKPPRKLRHKNY